MQVKHPVFYHEMTIINRGFPTQGMPCSGPDWDCRGPVGVATIHRPFPGGGNDEAGVRDAPLSAAHDTLGGRDGSMGWTWVGHGRPHQERFFACFIADIKY